MTEIAFFNGAFLPRKELVIHASDLSIHRGYGIFDYFVAENGNIIWFDDYLDRFYASAEAAKLKVPYKRAKLKEIIYKLLEENGKQKSGVKVILTGGYSDNGYTPNGKCNLILFNLDFPASPPDVNEKGVNLIMEEYLRPNPTIKTLNYFNSVLNQDKMKKYKAIDVLYHYGGIVYETSRTNLFMIKNGTVHTKGDGVLNGVTRKNVIELAKKHYPMVIGDFTLDQLLDADEVFITSSTKWIMPVVKIEDHTIRDGKVGIICKSLIDLYAKEVSRIHP